MATAEQRLLRRRLIDEFTGCWQWTGYCELFGHGSIGYEGSKVRVHRLAAHLWLDFDLDSELHVLHLCPTRNCFNPEHLYVGTNADNMKDKVRDGSYGNGRSGTRKLDDDAVKRILYLHAEGLSQHKIAKQFNVTQPSIRAIIIGRTHKHIERVN